MSRFGFKFANNGPSSKREDLVGASFRKSITLSNNRFEMIMMSATQLRLINRAFSNSL